MTVERKRSAMRKPIDWGLEYGFISWTGNGWEDVCWYAERGYQDIPHFIKKLILWFFKKDIYFKANINNKWVYLRKTTDLSQEYGDSTPPATAEKGNQ